MRLCLLEVTTLQPIKCSFEEAIQVQSTVLWSIQGITEDWFDSS